MHLPGAADPLGEHHQITGHGDSSPHQSASEAGGLARCDSITPPKVASEMAQVTVPSGESHVTNGRAVAIGLQLLQCQ